MDNPWKNGIINNYKHRFIIMSATKQQKEKSLTNYWRKFFIKNKFYKALINSK